MNQATLPQGVRQLAKWYEKGTLKFDLPIQRASGQWSLLQKSLLVHSILADYPIPALYLVKYKERRPIRLWMGNSAARLFLNLFMESLRYTPVRQT